MTNYTDRIQPSNLGITTYLDNLRNRKYQIPTFQRDVVWEADNVKKLWDSIYKFFPLGSILIWKTPIALQSHREIGGNPLPGEFASNEYQYILDGQQRTTALFTSLYGGKIAGRESFLPTLYMDLTIPAGDATDDDLYRQRFLFWNEIDDRGGELFVNSARKARFDKGLIVKLQDVRQDHGSVDERLETDGFPYKGIERSQLHRIKGVLDNYRLSFIELNGIQVSEVCQIFERINQAGKPLGIFDIVVAKTFRPATPEKSIAGFYLRELIDGFRKSPAMEKSNYRTLDDLTFLRMIAVLVKQQYPDAGIHNITDRYLNELKAEQIEGVWEDASNAFRAMFYFLDHVLHLIGPNLVPYGYFYLTLVSYFYKNTDPDYAFLEKYFWYHTCHSDDLLSNTTQLWRHVELLKTPQTEALADLGKCLIDRRNLRRATYSSRGRMSRAVLAMLANQEPLDWASPHTRVLSTVYYSLTDKPNLHHIFPTNFVRQSEFGKEEIADSLMNIAYLAQITNLEISDKNPFNYLNEYDVKGFDEILSRHLVPVEVLDWARGKLLPERPLESFIEARIDLMLDAIASKLSGIELVVTDGEATGGSQAQ